MGRRGGISRWAGHLVALHAVRHLDLSMRRRPPRLAGHAEADDDFKDCPKCSGTMKLHERLNKVNWLCQRCGHTEDYGSKS